MTYFLCSEHDANLSLPSGGPSETQHPAVVIDSFSSAPLALQAPPPDSELQQSLVLAKRNVCELRLQLNQLRHLQVRTCVHSNYNQCHINNHHHQDQDQLYGQVCVHIQGRNLTPFRFSFFSLYVLYTQKQTYSYTTL